MEIKSLKPKDKFGKKKMPKILKIILIILLISFVAFGVYAELNNLGYIKTLQLAWQIQNQQQADQKVLAQLKKIMLLPEDITPTMAIITDIEVLKKQQPAFFTNAKNNDRLIIYPEQAIIFDATANKIIKVGPVQLAQNQQQVQPVNFAIYNSLRSDPTNAKTDEMENKIKTAFNNAVVTIKANSTKVDYPKTLVVDLIGNNPEIEKIAQAVGGQISGLPIGEKKPEGVAVLIIIGKQ
jgi:hypothetical protein